MASDLAGKGAPEYQDVLLEVGREGSARKGHPRPERYKCIVGVPDVQQN